MKAFGTKINQIFVNSHPLLNILYPLLIWVGVSVALEHTGKTSNIKLWGGLVCNRWATEEITDLRNAAVQEIGN